MKQTANGTTLNYAVDGEKGAPWAVLAHGIATDLTLWDGVAPILAKGGFRVLRYDSRGHGLSAAPDGPYSLAMLGEDALGLMDGLGIERAHMIGLSMGGMVGLELATAHPERLLSLACCDARASATPDYTAAWHERAATAQRDGMEPLVEPSLARWFASGFRERAPGEAARVAAMVRATPPSGYAGSATALTGVDFAEALGQIRVPTLYLVGDEDGGTPPPVMRAMHEATPGSRYVEIPGAGHLSALERPAEVGAALLEFLRGVPA
ncbi:MAG: 3-oxoadipate enol-lactonase [Acetobacteraceae bacterium]